MPYQTGTFTSLADLQSTIETFATANGWTLVNGVLRNSTCHIKLEADTANRLLVRHGLDDDGVGNLITPTNGVTRLLRSRAGQTITFPATYHLFSHASPDSIFCIVNYNVAWCQHIAFGHIQKYGVWGGGSFSSSTSSTDSASQRGIANYNYTQGSAADPGRDGGAFFFAQYSAARESAAIACDIDGLNFLIPLSTDPLSAGEGRFQGASLARPYLEKLNSINLQPAMYPPVVVMGRPSSMGSVIGTVPWVRYLRVDNYEPGDIVTVGADKWMVFPHYSVAFSKAGWAIKYDGP